MFSCLKKYFYYCNRKINGGENFESWNDTSIAHMFIRLMTKINHPYSDYLLSREEFESDYELLDKYIDWRKNADIVQLYESSYIFTIDNMSYLLNKIDYDTHNDDELRQIWNTIMLKKYQS